MNDVLSNKAPEIEALSPDQYEVIGEKVSYRLAQQPGSFFGEQAAVGALAQRAVQQQEARGVARRCRIGEALGRRPVEQPGVAQSTLAREAYFVDFAQAMKASLKVPLMVTGGFRSRAGMEAALASGDTDLLLSAIGDVAKAMGMAQIARDTVLGPIVEVANDRFVPL